MVIITIENCVRKLESPSFEIFPRILGLNLKDESVKRKFLARKIYMKLIKIRDRVIHKVLQ